MLKNIKSNFFTLGTYFLLLLAILLICFVFLDNNKTLNNVVKSFFEVAENRTFDYRQMLRISHKNPEVNKDIAVIAIDDASLEILWERYGEWPISRSVYAEILNYIESQKPKAVIFDLMFIKSIKSNKQADTLLTDELNKYNNVYVAMNFDDVDPTIRKPIELPARLGFDIENNSKVNIKNKYTFNNCRPILQELLEGTVKIGLTNVIRNNDGIIRKIAPLMVYQDKYYPYLTFLAGNDSINGASGTKLVINSKGDLLINNNHKIPLTNEGEAILNWYGTSGSHTIYPMYKLLRQKDGKLSSRESAIDFKDKIVLIGTTAMSLHDTKSVPIQSGVYPGVEVHATFINNILDNNFIKKTDNFTDKILLLVVSILVASIVMYSNSTIFALLSTTLFGIAYLFASYYVMELFNLWIPVAIPILAIVIVFALSYIAKYIIKSKDFEYQYQLATIDGLTELYNHRYFQDTLRNQIEISKRYNQDFSLIIIDVDFFKKFNDKYGHQAGDAVLKQVAQILKRNSRVTDYVCRYGGEEMCIILPNTNSEAALFNANRIRKEIAENTFHLDANTTSNVTISLGVATYPHHGESAQELIEYADKCLYYAKENGRNQVGQHPQE